MRRPAVSVMVLLAMTSMVAAQPPASEAERSAAATAVFVCLDRAVAQFDDGRSDAATIAEAAVGACEQQFADMDDAYQRQESYYTRRIIARHAGEDHLKIALRSVLAYRNRASGRR